MNTTMGQWASQTLSEAPRRAELQGKGRHGLGRFRGPALATLVMAAVLAPVSRVHAQAVFEDSAGEPGAFTSETALELDSYVSQALEVFDVPGAAIAIVQGGEIVYRAGFGVRGLDCPGPVDEDTRFMVGSITKSMTSTLLGTLVDDELLDWDDDVVDYLPSFTLAGGQPGDSVTLRQVLSHNTGVPRYDLPLFITAPRPLELIDFVGTIELVAAPGEAFHYQNQVFALAGFAGASAAGTRLTNRGLRRQYSHLLRERVLEPTGMARATPSLRQVLHQPNHACSNGYSAIEGAMAPAALSLEGAVMAVAPSGAVWASVDDMAHYAAMQVHEGVALDGRRVISEAALQETHTVQVPLGPDIGYAMGWVVSEVNGVRIVEHNGGTIGFNAQLVTVPDLDTAIVILTNRNANAAFITAVQRYATELVFDLPHAGDDDLVAAEEELRQDLADLIAQTRPVTPEEVAPLTGRYESDLRLFESGGNLVVQGVHGQFLFRALEDADGIYIGADNVLPGLLLVPLLDEDTGEVTELALGFFDPESEEGLAGGVALARLTETGHRPPHHGHRRVKPGRIPASACRDWQRHRFEEPRNRRGIPRRESGFGPPR